MSRLFNPTVAAITLRSALGRRRAFLLAIPPAILLLVTLALKASRPAHAWPGHILGDFCFSVILPLTALVIGTSVLGAEIDEGSIIHLLATPVRRSAVIVTKFVVGTGLTMLFVAVPELIAGLIATSGDQVHGGQLYATVSGGGLVDVGGTRALPLALFVGALAGAVMYNALFVMISVVTTRAVAVGLLYVLIWEGLLGNLVGGARELSIGQYSLGVANAIGHDTALNAALSLTTAVVMGAIVTVAALVVASRGLLSFTVKGDAV